MPENRLIEFFKGDVISYDESGCAWKLDKHGKEIIIAALRKYGKDMSEPHYSHTVSEADHG